MSVPRADPGIVVGVDGSPASDSAVRWAARDAAMRNVALTLVHAFTTPPVTWSATPARIGVQKRLEMHAHQIISDAMKRTAPSRADPRKSTASYSSRLPCPR